MPRLIRVSDVCDAALKMLLKPMYKSVLGSCARLASQTLTRPTMTDPATVVGSLLPADIVRERLGDWRGDVQRYAKALRDLHARLFWASETLGLGATVYVPIEAQGVDTAPQGVVPRLVRRLTGATHFVCFSLSSIVGNWQHALVAGLGESARAKGARPQQGVIYPLVLDHLVGGEISTRMLGSRLALLVNDVIDSEVPTRLAWLQKQSPLSTDLIQPASPRPPAELYGKHLGAAVAAGSALYNYVASAVAQGVPAHPLLSATVTGVYKPPTQPLTVTGSAKRQLLWHGCPTGRLQMILKHGLDPRFANSANVSRRPLCSAGRAMALIAASPGHLLLRPGFQGPPLLHLLWQGRSSARPASSVRGHHARQCEGVRPMPRCAALSHLLSYLSLLRRYRHFDLQESRLCSWLDATRGMSSSSLLQSLTHTQLTKASHSHPDKLDAGNALGDVTLSGVLASDPTKPPHRRKIRHCVARSYGPFGKFAPTFFHADEYVCYKKSAMRILAVVFVDVQVTASASDSVMEEA